jgi:gluconate 2-dehydrogenase gamma chain
VERLSRREMLALIETVAVSMALVGCKQRAPASDGEPSGAGSAPKPATAFDASAVRALEAATARILPASADFAGARDARVMTFIDRQLAIEPFVRLVPGMVALARALDQQGIGRGKRAFAELDSASQDQVLDALSRGELPAKGMPQRELFRLLHGLTIEGFLADPIHGGNHGGAGWKAIDFAEPSLRTPGATGGHGHGR